MPTFGAACRVETHTLGGNPVFIAAAIGRGRTTTLRPLQHRPGGRNRVGSRRVASPTSSYVTSRGAFPEYHAYAANTPFLIPTKLGRMAHQAGHNKPSLEAIDPQAWHRASVESFHGKLDTMRSVIEVAALRGTRAKQSISGKADMAEAPKKSWKEAAQQLPPH